MITFLTTLSRSGFALEVISPATTTRSVLTRVSQATLALGSSTRKASKIASDIKSLKPVEPYKGKGIKERNQYVLRKEGKKK